MKRNNYQCIIFLVIIFALFPCLSEARINRFCKVSYKTEDGWSKEYTMEVSFATGQELFNAMMSSDFQLTKHYALLWFDEDNVAILEIEESYPLITGIKFENRDFRNLFMFNDTVSCRQIRFNIGKKWRIKAKESLLFIDPRAN
jgi:hypothetical protein